MLFSRPSCGVTSRSASTLRARRTSGTTPSIGIDCPTDAGTDRERSEAARGALRATFS